MDVATGSGRHDSDDVGEQRAIYLNFAEGGRNQTVSGTYTRQGDELVLTRQDDQRMAGVITPQGQNEFRFLLKNTVANNPDLDFSK